MKRLLLPGLAVLLAASCAAPPKRESPAASLPPAWVAGKADAGATPDHWWTTLGDTNLNAAIDEALAYNHDLQAAVARLDAALAQVRIAGADALPTLGAGLDGRRQQSNFIGLPIPGAGGRVLTSRSTTYGLNFNTSWELDLWGRIRAGRKAATADAEAARADLAGAMNSLAAQTARMWLSLAEIQRQVGLAEETVDSYTRTARFVRERYEKGLRSALDLRQALAAQHASEALLQERRAQKERVVRQLEILLGRYPAGRSIAGDLPEVPAAIPAGLPADLLTRRPDLVSAEQRLRAADQRVAQSRAALLPRISLTASGGTSSDELRDLLDTGFSVWTIAGNLAQPLFQGGKLIAGVDQAKARAREAGENYESAVLRAMGEVETALAVGQLLAQREQALALTAEQSTAARRLAEERYRQGLENFTTLLDAQRRALDAGTQLATVRRLRLETRVDLHLALGGGFTAPERGPATRSTNEQPPALRLTEPRSVSAVSPH